MNRLNKFNESRCQIAESSDSAEAIRAIGDTKVNLHPVLHSTGTTHKSSWNRRN